MTIHSAEQALLLNLKKIYDEREAINIMHWVMEHVTGKKKIDRIINKQDLLSLAQQEKLEKIITELVAYRPVQYVLGEAWFAGMPFYVNESTLIPRPETEELVDWASSELKAGNGKLLDIGTGSGCIAIALKKKKSDADITAIDISNKALAVATKNALDLAADITFLMIDFLDETVWDQFSQFDMIISNPPYIKQSEEKEMLRNVLAFEPAMALFVPDNDPLVFYRKIARFAKKHLTPKGSIFLEINEAHGKETMRLYENEGYIVELKKDLQGKDRMLKAYLSK